MKPMNAVGALAISMCALVSGAWGADPATPTAARAVPVIDWNTTQWRYHLTFRTPEFADRSLYYHCRGWHVAPIQGRIRTPDAPADWMKAQFDDSGWPRAARPDYGTGQYDPVVRVERLRARFDVPDPARVTGLGLHIEYAGGVAVFLNGQEIARRHLPPDELTADVTAEGYPEEAYEWFSPRGKTGGMLAPREWEDPTDPKARRFRTLSLALDPKLLNRGTNVLAVSVHQSALGPLARRWNYNFMGATAITGRAAESANQAAGTSGDQAKVFLFPWPHLMIKALNLSASPAGVAQAPAAPPGQRAWLADIHDRLTSRDRGEPGVGPPVLRLAGARNGTYSAQVVVDTSDTLARLAVRASDLTAVSGAGKIPAAAIRVRYAAGLAFDPRQPDLLTFDGLAERPPSDIPAGTCQPVWITVTVPKDAASGEYRGTLTITPGDLAPVGVRLHVMDWTLPDPKDFASFVGLQHSTWGMAGHYKVAPWSDEHWRLVARSMEWMGAVGNDTACLPIVCGGESGNRESIVAWRRKGDGYEYDWTNLDRYLDLVAKHWGTEVWLIGEVCWTPWRGGKEDGGWPVLGRSMTLIDGGKKEDLPLPDLGSDQWKEVFLPYAKALREHTKARGFEHLAWGWFYDGVPDRLRAMAEALSQAVPDVGWARASHNGNTQRPFPKESKATVALDMHIRQFPQSFDRKTGDPASREGWKQPGNILFPRVASQIQALDAFDSAMAHRWLTENCLVNGAAGFGRLGVDFWPPFKFNNWYSPFVTHLLHPGPDGAESSARFEALREGVQEAEVRIWLESAGQDKTEPAKTILAARVQALAALVAGHASPIGAYYAGWQERSWDLYAAAAAASGGRAPSSEDKAAFFTGPKEAP